MAAEPFLRQRPGPISRSPAVTALGKGMANYETEV